MIYKKIDTAQAKEFANLSSVAFHGNAQDAYKEIEKGDFLIDTIRVLEDEDGKVTAGLRLHDLNMYLDSGYVKCGGIGDVSSYPEYRREGNISELMEYMLKELYTDNYVISYLYPFSHTFYRKYGYELCMKADTATFKTENIPYSKDEGYVKLHVPGGKDDLSEDVKKIYTQYAQYMNMMVEREGWFWERIVNDNPFTEKARLYVCYLPDDTPIAYCLYEYKRKDDGSVAAEISDMAFAYRNAFEKMMRFVYRLAQGAKTIKMMCPPVINIYDFFDEPMDVSIKSQPWGMMRIVNVQKAFEAMKMPLINTEISIKVEDKILEQNDGVFTLSIDNGKVSVAKNDSAVPDAQCSIGTLSQLVCGFRTVDEIAYKGGITVKSKAEELKKLFAKKRLHIQDYF